MTFIKELMYEFDNIQIQMMEGSLVSISYEIELDTDPSSPITVQLLVQTEDDEDVDQGMDAKLTSARIENKGAMK